MLSRWLSVVWECVEPPADPILFWSLLIKFPNSRSPRSSTRAPSFGPWLGPAFDFAAAHTCYLDLTPSVGPAQPPPSTMAPPIDLTWNEALSGISGSISLASWIFLLVPQLIENYQNANADAISLTFLFIWFVGDVTNLVGAIWADLVPTVIAIAVYFCFADFVLIGQCLYYNAINRGKKEKRDAVEGADVRACDTAATQNEQTPLLHGESSAPAQPMKRRLTDVNEYNMGLPGSRRRSSRRNTDDARRNSLERILAEPTRLRAWLKNTVSILAIVVVGAAGWAIAWKTGAWRPTPTDQGEDAHRGPVGAEVLGYISAVCYLGARIPQIVKNQRERSCDGLSLLFFLLSLLGNATYGAGVSVDPCILLCPTLMAYLADLVSLRPAAVLPHKPALAYWLSRYHG